MNFARFFVDRPIFAAVLSILTFVGGAIAIPLLPVSEYPDVVPPTVLVRAVYPGANPKVIADTVATPLEESITGIENLMYMKSVAGSDGVMQMTLSFEPGTDVNEAQVQVQNRVAQAEARLPEAVRRLGVTTQKQSPDLTMVVHLLSPDETYDEVYLRNYGTLRIKDELARIQGVGEVMLFGAGDYSMRIWLDPQQVAARGLTAGDVVGAIREQNLWADVPYLTFPPAEVLIEAYQRADRGDGVDEFAVQRAALGTRTLVLAERLGAALEFDRVKQQMPWASGHYFTGSGGVLHTGKMIAGYYLHLWDKLQDGVVEARGPLVVGVHPDPGERGVPIHYSADRWVRVFLSGAAPRQHFENVAGNLVLFDQDGNIVPADISQAQNLYKGDDSAHGIGITVQGDLQPDQEYTAILTTRAIDARGKNVLEPLIWSFRTAAE
mgnify:CR=1 FL=1